jgi:hypothetical protein
MNVLKWIWFQVDSSNDRESRPYCKVQQLIYRVQRTTQYVGSILRCHGIQQFENILVYVSYYQLENRNETFRSKSKSASIRNKSFASAMKLHFGGPKHVALLWRPRICCSNKFSGSGLLFYFETVCTKYLLFYVDIKYEILHLFYVGVSTKQLHVKGRYTG